MWALLNLVFFASVIADIVLLVFAVIGVVLACIAHANEE